MTNVTKLALLGMGVPMAAGSAYLIHYLSSTGTFLSKLTLDGVAQILDNDTPSWKAKFIDFGEDIKAKVSSVGYTSGDANYAQANKLRDWCQKESEKLTHEDGYDTYFKLCSNKLNTVKAKLVSENLTLASQDNDWKLIFLGNRHDPSFIDRFKGEDQSSFTKSTAVSNAYGKVKSSCGTLLGGNLGKGDGIEYARKWCVKLGDNTIGQRLARATGFRRLSGDDYEGQHNRWKDVETYKTAIGADSAAGDKEKLKAYCEVQYLKVLTAVMDNYDTELKNTFNYCGAVSNDSTPATLKEITWQT